MKYARIIQNTAVDVRIESPEGCFTPNIVAEFVEVPDAVENGWLFNDGTWSAPPTPPAPVPAPRTWSVTDVRKGLTLSEKSKWDNDSTPEIVTAKIEFATPQELAYTTELLDYLVDSSSISSQSRTKILAENI